ncbi:branched-chain amino acid ABC transporter permease [Variovorax sp. M-6]|uniref:branched-chain amino acid ABC transporter permease n=1 Tax=Variovorax sp. M-6 TaxID=3233041 RepID=UPI003F9A62B8
MKHPAALPLASSPLRERSLRIRHVAVVWILFAAWPLVAGNDYVLSLGIFFFINLLLLGGLNLVMGYGGQISLCQAGFFGLGAYLSGVLSVRWGVPPAIGALAAMAGAALSAFVIGLPALRLRGHYLSMATLGFNAILSVLFNELVSVTGGPNGLSGVPPIALFGFAFDTPARFFWLAWLGGLAVMLLVASLLASRAGRALRAVSGSEVAADSMGIDPFRSKLAAFMASAVAAGLAGALYVHFNQYASPETFSFSASVLLVVMVAIGGWGRYWGPLFGAAVFTAVPELLRRIQDAELLVFGAGMVVVLLFLPGGIASLAARLGRRRKTAAPEPKKEKVARHGLA